MAIDEQKIARDLEIIRLSKEEMSATEISLKLDIPRTTVCSIIQKYKKFNTVLRLPGSGRRKSLDKDDVRIILSEIDKNPFTSSEKVKVSIEAKTEKKVSSRTVRNYIRTTAFRSRVPRKRPYLSKKNINRRMELCREWSSFEPDDWKKVIWSDETKINLFSSDGRDRVYRKEGEALNPKNCRPTVKHGGGSIMVWGCMSSKGVGKLEIIRGIMDKYAYKTIITKNLRSSAAIMGLDEDFIFQQDNDPKHTSDIMQDFFEKKDINVLEWPAQSPDLNPIEHLWDHLKRELRKFHLTSLRELETKVVEIWNSIPAEVCSKLVNTMNDRINCVLRAKGKHIPY